MKDFAIQIDPDLTNVDCLDTFHYLPFFYRVDSSP